MLFEWWSNKTCSAGAGPSVRREVCTMLQNLACGAAISHNAIKICTLCRVNPMNEQARLINRSMIVLMPTEAALEWVNRVDSTPAPLTLADIREEREALLVGEEIETLEHAKRFVHANWEAFFEDFLFDWYTDEAVWPKKRTLKMFKAWFEVQFTSMVWDIGSSAITHEEIH
jgi:hypothetical protein